MHPSSPASTPRHGAIIERHARGLVVEALADTRIVLIMGARQVGKTTLARQVVASDHPAQVVSLDDQVTRDTAQSDPTGFVAGLATPVLIDEVQRAPDVLYAIKAAVDRDTSPGRFLLTGSANILTTKRVYEALTGRMEIVRLYPLAQSEIETAKGNFVDALFAGSPPQVAGAPIGRPAFAERVARGGYPEARERAPARRTPWFRDYLETAIERDFQDLVDARRIGEMPTLLRLLGSQAANVVSYRKLASQLDLAGKTVQAYLKVLQDMFLVHAVPAWRPGLGAREVHKPKLYVVDSGLLAHLLRANERRIAEDTQVTGKVLENFCGMEVLKHIAWSETRPQLYHYRQGRDEVDMVLEDRAGDIACIEVKAAASVHQADFRPMAKLRDSRGDGFRAGIVLYTGEQTLPLGDRIWAVPISGLWA